VPGGDNFGRSSFRTMPSESSSLLLPTAAAAAPEEREAERGRLLSRLQAWLAGGSQKLHATLAVGSFVCFSMLMLPVNKMIMHAFSETPLTVVLIQMISAVAILALLPDTYVFHSWHDVWRWASMLPWLFAAMLATSMVALQYSSIGAYTVLRNVAPIIALPIEHFFQERMDIDVATVASLFVTLAGSVLYMSTDIDFSLVGTLLLVANMMFAITERLLCRRLTAVEPVKMSKSCMTFTSNAVGAIPIFVLILAFGEIYRWPTVLTKSFTDYLLLAASCILGVGLGWTSVAAQTYIQATTHMLLTNMNKILVMVFGILVLHETHTWTSILGASVSVSGGLWYAWARSRLSAAQANPVVLGKAGSSAETNQAAVTERGAGSARG